MIWIPEYHPRKCMIWSNNIHLIGCFLWLFRGKFLMKWFNNVHLEFRTDKDSRPLHLSVWSQSEFFFCYFLPLLSFWSQSNTCLDINVKNCLKVWTSRQNLECTQDQASRQFPERNQSWTSRWINGCVQPKQSGGSLIHSGNVILNSPFPESPQSDFGWTRSGNRLLLRTSGRICGLLTELRP